MAQHSPRMIRAGWPADMLTLLLSICLGSCSATDVLNGFASGRNQQITTGIAYAASADQTLDIYAPANSTPQAPTVVFFHGGNWETGSPAQYRFLGSALARRGVTVVIAGYRHYPEVLYPGFLEDAALAVRWTHTHVTAPQGKRLFLMGHSAGAHIAAMLTLDERWLGKVGLKPDRDIAGLVGLSGPYDFLPLRSPTLKAIFGTESNWPETQPIRYVHAGAPPMFLATGCVDRTVDPGNTNRLAAAQRAAGGIVVERGYPGIGHALTIGAFAGLLHFSLSVREDVLSFLTTSQTPLAQENACLAVFHP